MVIDYIQGAPRVKRSLRCSVKNSPGLGRSGKAALFTRGFAASDYAGKPGFANTPCRYTLLLCKAIVPGCGSEISSHSPYVQSRFRPSLSNVLESRLFFRKSSLNP